MGDLFNLLVGMRTYLAAAGLFGLSLYQFSEGQYELAIQSLLAALAALGIRAAISNSNEEQKKLTLALAKKNEETK